MKLTIVALLCLLVYPATSLAQKQLPKSARQLLSRRLPGWRFVGVSPEVRQFFKQEMKGASPVLITGDFDGDRRLDYAAIVERGHVAPSERRFYLAIFLRRNNGYKMHFIKNPNGEYITVAKKGTQDYNYETEKEITYANDAVLTGIFEKGGSSFVYYKGRFVSFISSD
jgi:hypothetical protein